MSNSIIKIDDRSIEAHRQSDLMPSELFACIINSRKRQTGLISYSLQTIGDFCRGLSLGIDLRVNLVR